MKIRKRKKGKKNILLNKEITKKEEDFIGIDSYVESLKKAIKEGAQSISISSKYGGGKSSICNGLIAKKKFNRVSKISLWDVIIDSKETDINIITLYKSFLFQLSADFYSEKYSRYISKVLNKSTGVLSVFFKTKIIKFCFLLSCFFGIMYLLLHGVEKIKLDIFRIIFETTQIKVNIDFFKYLFLALAAICLIIVIFCGRIVYTSWKSECKRELSISDMITLYAGIINDSIKCPWKKSIIIIEDIDRCKYPLVAQNFIKSVIKLIHFDCKNILLKKKLKNIVMIFCLDEQSFIESNNEEELLKLFDYRLDVGEINFSDFTGTFNKMLEDYDLLPEERKKLEFLLSNKETSIRLLKNAVNDSLLKQKTLLSRFPKSDVKFEKCVIYSYLKNYYAKDFSKILKDNNAINIIYNVIDNKSNVNEILNLKQYNNNFLQEIVELIKKNLISEDFKVYFYNYPMYEKVNSIEESLFIDYIDGNIKLEDCHNEKLSEDFIKNMADKINRRLKSYPKDIIKDKYVFSILLNNHFDNKLYDVIESYLLFTDKEYSKELSFINICLRNQIEQKLLFPYLNRVYIKYWCVMKLQNEKDFYEFREKLVSLYKDEIIKFDKIFKGQFQSLTSKEYSYIQNKKLCLDLINKDIFTKDLEDIIPEISQCIDIKDKIELSIFWSKNIINKRKYVEHTVKVLDEYDRYNNIIFKELEKYFDLVEKSETFANYLNRIVSKADNQGLLDLNSHHIWFGYNYSSLLKFVENSIFGTPIVFMLKNEMYDSLSKLTFECESRFNYFLENSKFSYLNTYICSFKKYILEKTNLDAFNYLFLNKKFKEMYYIDITINNAKNLQLLVLLYKHNIGNIKDVIIKNKHLYGKDDILTLLKIINKEITSYAIAENDLIITILNNYENICKEIAKEDKIIEQIIDQLEYEYKQKAMVYYQVKCDNLIFKYYKQIKNISEEDLKMYVNYLNSLPIEKLDIEIFRNLNTKLKLNDGIISLLIANGYLEKALYSAIYSNNYKKLDDVIDKIDFSFILDYIENREKKAAFILSRKKCIDKFIEHNKLNDVNDEIIYQALLLRKFDEATTRKIFEYLDKEKVRNIFLSMKKLNYNQSNNIINIISSYTIKRKINIRKVKLHLTKIIHKKFKNKLENIFH